MNILDKIVMHKQKEVVLQQQQLTTIQLEQQPLFSVPTISLKQQLEAVPGVIAEFKRKSPSRQNINLKAQVNDVARGYATAGAAGMSVLTDQYFFGGGVADFSQARATVQLPLLRKEFIINEYQVVATKAMGADVLLLIAAILSPTEVKQLAALAKSLGLEVLLEVREERELQQSLNSYIDMVGVNNRNLKTFEVNIDQSLLLADLIPTDCVKISESGLSDPEAIRQLQQAGYRGFLIGETFMKTNDPGLACQQLVSTINHSKSIA